jgi:hypothetical protein
VAGATVSVIVDMLRLFCVISSGVQGEDDSRKAFCRQQVSVEPVLYAELRKTYTTIHTCRSSKPRRLSYVSRELSFLVTNGISIHLSATSHGCFDSQ